MPAVGTHYIVSLCKKAGSTRTAALIAFLYLFGRRIREAIHVRVSMIQNYGGGWVGYLTPVLKQGNPRVCRECKDNGRVPDDRMRMVERVIGETEGHKIFECQVCGHQVERKIPYEIVRVYLESPITQALWPFIQKRMDELKPHEHLFKAQTHSNHITPEMAWQLLHGLDPNIWVHWVRHQRASSLVRETEFDAFDLKEFMKWKSLETAADYVHEARVDEKMKKG